MPIAATSVVSAAVIGGDLILGLSDGAIINCGRVQGPQGLKGDQGPMGATGRAGLDGNTIHTVAGAPDGSLGRDGDFAINSVAWEIYGPKAGGTWGTGTPMLGGGERNQREVNKGGSPKQGQGGGDYRPPIISPDGDLTPPNIYPGAKPLKDGDFWVDGNGALHIYYRSGWHKIRVYSDMVLPAGDAPAGSSRDVGGSVTVPGNGGTGQAIAEAANGETFANQYEYNNWLYYRVDRPPIVADDEPAEHPNFPVTGLNAGDFWINARDQIYTWKANQWTPLFAKGLLDVSDQAPADPQLGQLWFNTKPEELTLYVSTLDDLGQSVWAPAAPPVSLDGIQSQINNALIIQEDLLARVASGEGKQRMLENKVAALEGTVVDGVWKYGSRAWPQNRGEFDIALNDETKTTAWQDGQKLRIYKTDMKDRNFTFSEVSVADFVRIGQLGSNAIYKLLSEARNKGDYFEFLVEIVTYEGEAMEAILEYNFEFLPAFDATAYATKEYVDSMDELNVKKAGSTMTGDLKFDGGDRNLQIEQGNRLRITAKDASNNGRTFLDIQTSNSNGTEGTDAGYRLKIYHLATPTDPLHAANKKYVDDAVTGISIPDAGVQETDRIIPKPSRWTYKKDQDRAEDLGRGEFMFSAAKDRLYLAHWNEFGYRWFVRAAEYRWTFNGYTMVSITDYEGGIKFMAKISNINFNVNGSSSDNNYCRLDLEHGKLDMEPFNNSRYLITIPGLLPSWRYEPFSEYGRPT